MTGFVSLKQRALQRAQPLSVHLELTYACNWRCVFCYNPRHHDRTRLSAAEWEPVLDDLRELGALTVTLTGGEPLTHPDFFAIAAAVRARRFAWRLFTNGSLVSDEVAARLRALDPLSVEVSLHGASAGVHDGATGRPGSLAALWTGVDHLREAGLPVVVKTPLTRENEVELDEMIAAVEARGLPHRIDPVLTARDGGDPAPLQHAASFAGVERLMARLAASGRLPHAERTEDGVNCGLGRLTLGIDPEGNVYPCLQWRHQAMGNVRQTRLLALWRESLVRVEAADVARRANVRLHLSGGAASRFPFCPALAYQKTGDPLAPDDPFLAAAAAADRLRPRPA